MLESSSGMHASFSFVPHLVPITRGIYTTIHANLAAEVTEANLFALFDRAYAASPFVRIKQSIPQIKDVAFTNYCDVAFVLDLKAGSITIVSVIDNLVKGAAGQAIQNMNVRFGLPETSGLFHTPFTHHTEKEIIYV